jgi:hypothetical protein
VSWTRSIAFCRSATGTLWPGTMTLERLTGMDAAAIRVSGHSSSGGMGE